jgi:hypothetical protein
MSYTNIDLIKKHISFSSEPIGGNADYPVTFSDDEWITLPNKFISPGSIIVKYMNNFVPIMEEITFLSDSATLAHKPLALYSLTVASDSSLGTIYVENKDFAVDCANGVIIRKNGGAIQSGSTVLVWYYYFSIYTDREDYDIDYSAGKIKRLTGGEIIFGQTVQIDYQILSYQAPDETIVQAADEANAILENEIDPLKAFGANQALQTAGTYLAMSLLCRIMSAGALTADRRSASSSRNDGWLNLGDSYRRDYESLIKSFRRPASKLNRPAIS